MFVYAWNTLLHVYGVEQVGRTVTQDELAERLGNKPTSISTPLQQQQLRTPSRLVTSGRGPGSVHQPSSTPSRYFLFAGRGFLARLCACAFAFDRVRGCRLLLGLMSRSRRSAAAALRLRRLGYRLTRPSSSLSTDVQRTSPYLVAELADNMVLVRHVAWLVGWVSPSPAGVRSPPRLGQEERAVVAWWISRYLSPASLG